MDKKKFYIAVDCEGCACVVGIPGQGLGDGRNYQLAQRQAALEANAAATALFEMGAEEVIVWDNHGSGVNLDYSLLDKRCKIALGSGHHGRFMRIDESFGGVLFIGYHARDNTRESVLAHTYSSVTYQSYTLNGTEVGEMQIDAACAALKDVPVIFAVSDDKAVAQARESFPWIESVVTKDSLSWNSAISKHPLAVCDEIHAAVKKACMRLDEMRCYRFETPIECEIRFKRMDSANSAHWCDREGKPFGFKDPFTRVGVIDSIERLF